jgi:hypothetical protein
MRRRQAYTGTFPPLDELVLILAGALLAGAAVAIGGTDAFMLGIGSAVLIVLALMLQVRRQM